MIMIKVNKIGSDDWYYYEVTNGTETINCDEAELTETIQSLIT